jgi:succinate dehydrogenase / fumarate reductase cytochrome b subunit
VTAVSPEAPSRSWFSAFYRSAIGKKAIMAVSGIFLFGWILAHMLGNMKLYFGPEHMNSYASWLRTIGAPFIPEKFALNITRVLLLVAAWLHIQAATQLTLMNRRARPVGYNHRDYVEAS